MSPNAAAPSKRIGHGMQQDIGVAVADRVLVVGNVDAADPQRASLRQPMRVMAKSHAKRS